MKPCILFLSCILSIAAFAQHGSLTGVVHNQRGEPLSSANIALKGAALGTRSDDHGRFTIQNIPVGAYILTISMVGNETHEQAIAINSDEVLNLPAIVLAEKQQQLSEVVVSGLREATYVATKPSESLRITADLIEVPQNINVATRQTLKDMGMLSKGEIARVSSGLTRSYGGLTDMTLQIRGTDATYGTYRNGIGGPIWWNAQEDANMIERIEFVKGPAGFMLANSEPGGLVNTVTKQPTHASVSEISFGVGSFNMMRTAIDLGGEFRKGGKLLYRFNAGAQKNNEYYHFGAFNRLFVAPALTYEFSDKTSLTVEYNYVQAQTQENTHSSISVNGDFWAIPMDLAINDPNNKIFRGADSYSRMHLRHKLNNNWTFNAQGGYMTTDWSGTTLYLEGISAGKDTLDRALSMNDWWGKLINTQLFLDGKFNTGQRVEHKVLIGIDFGDGSEGSTYGGTWGENKFPLSLENPTYYLPKDSLRFTGETFSWSSSNRWMALYLQDHIKLFDKLVVTLAGRLTVLTTGQDWNSPPDDPEYEITNTKFTPRLGLTYLFSDAMSVYALHDESFLPQRGAIFGGGRLPVLTGSNNEIGIKTMLLQKQLFVNASVYDIRKNDVGTTDQLHPGFYLKTGQVRSTGFDFDVMGKVTPELVVTANYSYVNARITKDDDETLVGLRNNGTAAHLANAWMKYTIGKGILQGLGFGAGMQYTGERSGVWPGWNSASGNMYVPANTLFDASLSYTTDRFSVIFNIYNLTNVKYAANGSYYPDLEEWIFDVGTPSNFRLQTTIRL